MAADRMGRWENVRRALGRLTGRVTTHSLPDVQTGIPVSLRSPVSLILGGGGPGVRQAKYRPSALVRGLPTLAALAGAGGIDLAAVVTTIGADGALKTRDVSALKAALRVESPAVQAGMTGGDGAWGLRVYEAPVGFAQEPALSVLVIRDAPPVRTVPVVRADPAQSESRRQTPWKLTPVRTRSGLRPILRAPLTCHRLPPPPVIPAFAAERRLLATSSGVPDEDVALIGVFPHVPLGAVHRLTAMQDGTALQIWLRSDVAGRGATIPTVTVVLGRQRSTGKTLQSVRRGQIASGVEQERP